ncbi:MAG: hypothetical protein NC453_24225 [Muribaculum sp.]|nr:hypothetical protein [Muribaculum sp.]
MGTSFIVTIIISLVVSAAFIGTQFYSFSRTAKYRKLFEDFFKHSEEYKAYDKQIGGEELVQLKDVGDYSDLNQLIAEINYYIEKTKGTTDFALIQNKVERKLNMRYDQSTAELSFPTYLGLMGTFSGVFLGILMFIFGFDGASGVTDDSIKNLLIGVLVSMATSLVGLIMTTINISKSGEAKKKVEEDKNDFFDFIQTEVMPSVDFSMVTAITKLHQTVDKFEPAFDRVIDHFQTTFDKCTKAFGNNFREHVNAISVAVGIMGQNMNKINDNIDLQKRLLATLKGKEFVKGIDKYIEAAEKFHGITKSLDKFEEARRMMLAAAQEAIGLQNKYAEYLTVPRDIAVRLNRILDRINTFEENLNALGPQLNNRHILGNDAMEAIKRQIQGISAKGEIADRFLEMADGKLEDLYKGQIKVLTEMNDRYKAAIEGHIEGFEKMIARQVEELEHRHTDFIRTLEEKFNVEEVRDEFTNLRKLQDIDKQIASILDKGVSSEEMQKQLQNLKVEVRDQMQQLNIELKTLNKTVKESSKGGIFGGIFGGRRD